MIRIPCGGVLLDLDGVLADSTPAVVRVWTYWAVKHGFDPDEVVHKAHGRPSITTVREYLPEGDAESENREIEQREIEDVGDIKALPGAVELLQALPRERWTIVTSCTRPLAVVRIRAAGMPLPKYLVTSSDITRGKPDPEPYLKGAAKLGLVASDCVVIEDAGAGVRSGKAAGARVIALRTSHSEAELRVAGADWIVDDCTSISVDRTSGLDPLVLALKDDATGHV
ncbi:MAG: HAD family hydrolase [Candidatus Acidiferrales bacterium]